MAEFGSVGVAWIQETWGKPGVVHMNAACRRLVHVMGGKGQPSWPPA